MELPFRTKPTSEQTLAFAFFQVLSHVSGQSDLDAFFSVLIVTGLRRPV